MNSGSQGYIQPPKEDNLPSSPVFIDKGVLVGFWYDASGTGRRRVYCLVDKAFEFAYQEGTEFIPVREIDFNPLRGFGDWQGDDSEAKMKKWVRITWNRRDYLGKHVTLGDLTFHEVRESKLSKAW